MSYIKRINLSGKQYWVLYHTIRVGHKVKRLSQYIGKKLPTRDKLNKIKNKFVSEIKFSTETPRLTGGQVKILEKIRKKYNAHLRKLAPLDMEKFDEFSATNFTYNTNAIEGGKLSLADVQGIFKGVVPEGKDLREIYGAENMRKAYGYIKAMKRLSEKRILELHRICMQDILPIELGKYRSVQVYVGSHIPPPPEKVRRLMKDMLVWYKIAGKRLHPFELACILHVKFESIHPFRDGNGRVGRLAMNFVLLDRKYPLLDIKFDLRPGYYAALEAAQSNGNFKQFIDYAFKTYVDDAKEKRWL